MKYEVIVWVLQLSECDHLHKMNWVVMQIPRHKKPPNISKMNAGTSPLGILAQYVRGAQQEIGHPHRAQMVNINQRH